MREHYRVCPDSKSGLVSLRSGKEVGCVGGHGYWQVSTRKHGVKLAHRVIWELTHGPIPEGMQIDHINRIRTDNSLENLRLVTCDENAANTGKHRDNKVGHKNISKHQSGFMVEVMRKGVRVRKPAATLEEAIALREEILNGTTISRGA